MEPIARTPEAASTRGGACDPRRSSAPRVSIPTHDDARSTDGPEIRQTARLPVLLTVDEAADVLRTTRRAIYAMIERRQVEQVKRHLHDRAPKTVNNVLTVLSVLLKKAMEWDVIDRVPCVIRLLPVPKPSVGFYDFDHYERLIQAAKSLDRTTHVIVLLGGDAGLRCGEMMALEWRDVDLQKRQLCVQRSDWKGHVTVPKGGRLRYVPLTVRLAATLRDHRHLRCERVLCQPDGSPMSADIVKHHVERAARRAQIAQNGVHRLRHYSAFRTMPSDVGTNRAQAEVAAENDRRSGHALGIVSVSSTGC
jgi:integrase